MEKEKKELVDYTYAFGRWLSAKETRKWNPKVVHAEVIPQTGPIILCGNHLHKNDQFPVMLATKRTIHWMAKDEYFMNPKSRFVMNVMGCIPVMRGERKSQDHSSEIAIEYLKKGHAVGLFPEGTRNVYQIAIKKLYALKEQIKNATATESADYMKQLMDEYQNVVEEVEQAKRTIESKGNHVEEGDILLPFKYGAVHFAHKVPDAQIVPFAVTGDYKENSDNLMVRFGEPYYLESTDYDVETKRLRDKVRTLVLDNYKQTGYR